MSRRTLILVGVLMSIAAALWYLQKPVAGPAVSLGSGKDSAKEFVSPSGFVNAEPFTMASLVGKKVILVDFWTYSCINCQRTMPYLNEWYAKYKDKGLVIVGVHTPEFEFEKDIDNVRAGVRKFGIQYPVVLDNDYGTWQAYQNQYWPHEYLIDLQGQIVHDHIGEGGYEDTEREIQRALGLTMAVSEPVATIMVDFNKIGTPELYLGSRRNGDAMGNAVSGTDGVQTLTIPISQNNNQVYLGGTWSFTPEYVKNVASGTRVRLRYTARQVNIVAGADTPVTVTVLKDGKPVRTVTVSGQTLYTLIDDTAYGTHDLELDIQQPGLQLFTFTFS